jgi:hypothetical protein
MPLILLSVAHKRLFCFCNSGIVVQSGLGRCFDAAGFSLVRDRFLSSFRCVSIGLGRSK